MAIQPASLDPFSALARAFLARFFENEFTAGFDDLKGAFFWMVAALMVPGLFIPWMMSFDWQFIATFKGAAALREAAQAEKVFYLGFAMVTSGLLTTIVWSSLLPDRRDTLILGALPVSSSTIVGAKLVALAAYILLVSVSMHAISAIVFGLMLATNAGVGFAVRGILAHFVAASAASASVALGVAAAQGVALAVAGPKIFRRLSPVLHGCLVACVAVALATLPVITFSVVHTLRGSGSRTRPWILDTPAVWFLGLYEWLLGTSNPVLLELARNAGLTLLIALAVTLLTYPLAYRRQMVSATEDGHTGRTPARGGRVRRLLTSAAGADPEARAAADFFTATLTRVERHRVAVALSLGLLVAWNLVAWTALDPAAEPAAGWLSLPLSSMVFLAVGLRITASLPSNLRAAWLFDLKEPSRGHARRALERIMLLVAVVPPVVFSAPLYWWFWGTTVALIHAASLLAIGATIVELLIWQTGRMPCGQPWNLLGSNIGFRWPLYAAAFFLVTVGVPRLEVLVLGNVKVGAAYVALWTLVAAGARYASARHALAPDTAEVDSVTGVLGLN